MDYYDCYSNEWFDRFSIVQIFILYILHMYILIHIYIIYYYTFNMYTDSFYYSIVKIFVP